MEELNKNRELLRCQYYGQEVLQWAYGFPRHKITIGNIADPGGALVLIEPHSITDEHAKVIAVQNRFAGTSEEAKIRVGRDILNRVLLKKDSQMCLPMETADFMRQNGYALPFNGSSIEDQVYSGLVTLITRTEEERRS